MICFALVDPERCVALGESVRSGRRNWLERTVLGVDCRMERVNHDKASPAAFRWPWVSALVLSSTRPCTRPEYEWCSVPRLQCTVPGSTYRSLTLCLGRPRHFLGLLYFCHFKCKRQAPSLFSDHCYLTVDKPITRRVLRASFIF